MLAAVNRRRRIASLVGLGIGSLVIADAPLGGLRHVVVTRPVLTGLLVAYFAFRFGIPAMPALLAGSVPVVALVSIALLVDANVGADLSGRYRLLAWALFVVLDVVSVAGGALLGSSRHRAV
jgi:hypothetical protein